VFGVGKGASVLTVQDSLIRKYFWTYPENTPFQTFQNLEINLLVRHKKLFMYYSLAVTEKNQHCLDF
jgi:hypothetical protein